MASAIRIANWVVIKILINYLLLFHREEISAYLIGITEMYYVPHLHKLNVKNKSTACIWARKRGSKRECMMPGTILRWFKSGLLQWSPWMVRLRPMMLKVLWFGCLTEGLRYIKREGQTRGSQQPFCWSYRISLYQNQSQQILFSAHDAAAPAPTIPSETSYRMICTCLFISISALHML